mmetsp:Transcript_18514/g.48297  ORF Transcript_18514/g.48297 Transcript_18514/m.48297 type:complete len:218 (-) Transcript_18514:106-759(-)
MHEPAAGGTSTTTSCGMLVLTGPIPQFIRGSEDGSTPAIVTDPSNAELEIFGPMVPMQYYDAVVRLSPAPMAYRGIESFPQGYHGQFGSSAGVVLRRDIRFTETNASGAVGGVMSYSYWPEPAANLSSHQSGMQQWAHTQGFRLDEVYAELWVDTYAYHYRDHSHIAQGKPWRVWREIQLLPGLRTIYAGGAANFETVEDSLYFNLFLVDSLFDHPD